MQCDLTITFKKEDIVVKEERVVYINVNVKFLFLNFLFLCEFL